MDEKESREDTEKVFKLIDNASGISFRNVTRVTQELGRNIDDDVQHISLHPG